MLKTYISIPVILLTIQTSCVFADNKIDPSLKIKAFPGFSIETSSNVIKIKDAMYSTKKREDKEFKNCKEVLNYNYERIATFEQFQFKALTSYCIAINKFIKANYSEKTFFPSNISKADIKYFPALSTPFINSYEYETRFKKTIDQVHKKITISYENNRMKLLTKEDEFYIDIIARGDFNNDKIEDLLISSDWYARHAHGKHTDLVILSKTSKDSPITIQWRLNKPR